MIHNGATPKIEIDPETYDVRADGELLVCEPADKPADGAAVFFVLRQKLHPFAATALAGKFRDALR